MTDDRARLVVLRALGLGHLCTAVPALRALRAHHPHHHLVLAAPRWQEPLARAVGVDEVVHTRPLEPLSPELDGADLAVNLHGHGPQSTTLLAATGPRQLIAFDPAEWRPDEHEVQRWCRLLTEAGIPADPTQLQLPTPSVEPAEPAEPAGSAGVLPVGAVVVHAGAAAPARRWPAERFGAVVRAVVDAGARVVLTGSAGESHLTRQVAASADLDPTTRGMVADLAGRTGLAELMALVAGAPLVVANDTGVAHLASGFGTPSVVLFGPTSPATWGPPDSGPHIALWAGQAGDPHGDHVHPGLASIGVAHVLDAVDRLGAIRHLSPRVRDSA